MKRILESGDAIKLVMMEIRHAINSVLEKNNKKKRSVTNLKNKIPLSSSFIGCNSITQNI